MVTYSAEAWQALHGVVEQARAEKGLADIKQWERATGYVRRQLSEPSRGRPVGPKALEAIETALDWPHGHCYVILRDPSVGAPVSVTIEAPTATATVKAPPGTVETTTLADRVKAIEERVARLEAAAHLQGVGQMDAELELTPHDEPGETISTEVAQESADTPSRADRE